MLSSIKKIWDVSEREIRKMKKQLAKVNAFEDKINILTDEELRSKTIEFKEKIANGEKLDNLLPEAFAVVREASKRVLNMRHYDVQIIGGIALHEGNIAEMRTGEGKTLVATLPAYLNALEGKGVHIITVNDYLAKRDSEELAPLYEFLGLTVGLNISQMSPDEKRKAYYSDITYGTNHEFGFDYLRDNMVLYKEEKVQRGLNYTIVDEVDSILIDEARTPLIISGASDKSNALYVQADLVVKTLIKEKHYTIDEKIKSIMLTEEGVTKVEKSFGVKNLYELEYGQINHHVEQALKANYIMMKDKDYVVQNGQIKIVDGFTGRIMEGRRYSDGLHQAIEAKEKVEIQNEMITLASITYQNFFRMYNKLSGMTGTAKTEEEEFRNIYNMNTIVIPTNKPVIRIDHHDRIYMKMETKFKAAIKEIVEKHKKGQPILVGTANIETSEYLSELLQKENVSHYVLNAKYHEQEAQIIAQAGQKNAVTIATNMAGRGTDIKLGEGVTDLGGLCVIGTERHESRRIDNQLRGRSGRQGDAGESIFFLSLEDELLRRFGSENLSSMLEKLGIEEDEAIVSKMVTKAVENAQKRVEGNNFDARKHVLQYDEVLHEQRNIVYKQRDEILESEHLREMIEKMIYTYVEQIILSCTFEEDEEEWRYEEIIAFINGAIMNDESIKRADVYGKVQEEIIEFAMQKVKEKYDKQEEMFGAMIREFEKVVTLRCIDRNWINHIEAMEQLKQGIHLRGYGQIDPLREYQTEGFEMFEGFVSRVSEEVTHNILKSTINGEEKREEAHIIEEKEEEKPIIQIKLIQPNKKTAE